MPIEVRPLGELDNGALLQIQRDFAEDIADYFENRPLMNRRAQGALDALEILEGRASFQGIKNFKD